MQIELSPMTGVMLGVNYAYYEPTQEEGGLHLIQVAIGLVMLNISWAG